mgnify:FL=1
MPKLKIKRSITRRFKLTGTGKVMAGRSFTSHLKSKKTSRAKRALSIPKQYSGKIGRKIKMLLGAA